MARLQQFLNISLTTSSWWISLPNLIYIGTDLRMITEYQGYCKINTVSVYMIQIHKFKLQHRYKKFSSILEFRLAIILFTIK